LVADKGYGRPMNSVRAFLVGIEHYGEDRFSVEGPGRAALEVAIWLLSRADFTIRLDIFISKELELKEHHRTMLLREGVTVHRNTDRATIDEFARIGLKEDVLPNTCLFFYWSGHGFVDATTQNRFLLCGDFRGATADRVFNLTSMTRLWRTAQFACFNKQAFFVDACGVERDASKIELETHSTRAIPQLICYATPDGEWAKSQLAGGLFTEITLGVLRSLQDVFSDLGNLKRRLREAFQTAGASATKLETWNEEDLDRKDYALPANESIASSAFDLLAAKNWQDPRRWRRQFDQVVVDLAEPILNQEKELRGALTELAHLRDGSTSGDWLSYGLLSFMMRMAQVGDLRSDIENWLNKYASRQQADRDEIARCLEAEKRKRILLIDVMHDAAGQIKGFRPHLCRADGKFDDQLRFDYEETAGWARFVDAIQRVLSRLTSALVPEGDHIPLENFQIHFIVDTPLLNRAFHLIPSAQDDIPIGARCVVLLRSKSRMFSDGGRLAKLCSIHLRELRETHPTALNWSPIDDASNTPVPSGRGLYYAAFALPEAGGNGLKNINARQRLQRLLIAGAPILCFSHNESSEYPLNELGETLNKRSRPLPHLDAFVEEFSVDRGRDLPYAVNASLVWDDPAVNPFLPTYGVYEK